MGDEIGFANEQLMELAGLACAMAVRQKYPLLKRVLVLVGPGNNGGKLKIHLKYSFFKHTN